MPESAAPPLFSRVSRARALAAFGADAGAASFCDDQFVRLETVVLVFVTLEGEDGTRLAYADLIEWCGRELPIAVREGRLDHVLLVRRPRDDDSWLYCGRAHLGSFGTLRDGAVQASFSLMEGRLSPEDWRALGGREIWEIHLKGEARELAPDDGAGFAEWLAGACEDALIDIFMTAPSGATFAFFVNVTRAAVFFMEGMAEPFSLALREPGETSEAEETFFECLGPAEFTHERFLTLPRAAGLAAAAAAFRGALTPQAGAAFDLAGVRTRWSAY